MTTFLKTTEALFCLFLFFMSIFFLLLAYDTRTGLEWVGADNDYIFLRTLQSGKPLVIYSESFPYSDPMRDDGRWQPLVNMEYNLVSFLYNLIHHQELKDK